MLPEALKTVFATGSPMIDKKNLGKRPPSFPHTPWKNLGRRVCVDRVEHMFYGDNREFFFWNFKYMTGVARGRQDVARVRVHLLRPATTLPTCARLR
jgi:hypothetical protein